MKPIPEPELGGAPTDVRRGRRASVVIHPGSEHPRASVLFVHGAGGSKNQWRAVWPPLSSDGLRLIAWDGPVHGESPAPRRAEAYATSALTGDAETLLDRHGGGGPVILVGHSYGTVVTIALLLRLEAAGRLGEIAGVLLLAPPPPGFSFAGPIVDEPLAKLRRMRPALERGFREAAWGADADPALVDYEEAMSRGNRLSVMQMLMRSAEPPAPADLARITTPLSILAGAQDQLTPPDAARALAAALPEARLEVLPGCGHQIMLEKPDAVVDALRAFAPRS